MSAKMVSAVLESSDTEVLTGSTLLVYLILADMAGDAGMCWPLVGTVARKGRMSERTTQVALAKLQESGMLRRWSRGRNKSWMYQLTPVYEAPPMRGAESAPLPEDYLEGCTPGVQPAVAEGCSGLHPELTTELTTTPGSSSGSSSIYATREERSTLPPPPADMWDTTPTATPPPSDDSQRARIFDMPVTGRWWPSKETWDELRPTCKHIDPATERLSYAAYCVEKDLTPTDEGFKRWAARSEGWALERYNLAASPPLPPRRAWDCDWPN